MLIIRREQMAATFTPAPAIRWAALLTVLSLALGASALAQCTYIGEARIGDQRGLSLTLDSSSQAGLSLTVATQTSCSTSIVGRPDWITFGGSTTTFETVTINGTTIVNAQKRVLGLGSVKENLTATPRTATISVGGITFTITQAAGLSLISAASFQPTVAVGSISSVFGVNFSSAAETATSVPLPTSLAGANIQFTAFGGNPVLAPLFFVSPAQINFQMPPGLAAGIYRVAVLKGGTEIAVQDDQIIGAVAPGLFTFSQNGQGVPAAVALRVSSNNQQTTETIYQLEAPNRYTPKPIDLGPEGDRVFLVLFGTGIRGRSALSAVKVTIGGVDAMVGSAGEQGGFVGLDQVNALIPRSLIGRGDVNVVLTVDGQQANVTTINIR